MTNYSCNNCSNNNGFTTGIECKDCFAKDEYTKPTKWKETKIKYKSDSKKDVHYIEIMQMYFTKEQMIGYLRGNILKYNLLYGHKDITAKETTKIAQYYAWLYDVENGKKIDPRKGA